MATTVERKRGRGSLIDLDTRLETLNLSNKAGTGEAKAVVIVVLNVCPDRHTRTIRRRVVVVVVDGQAR